MADKLRAKSRRSGSERRQRTNPVILRLLPAEASALRVLAQEQGHPSIQALIVETLQPLFSLHDRKADLP